MSFASKEYLKTRFEVGDSPSQKDFEDLIDSCHNGLFETPKVLENMRIGADTAKGLLTVGEYLPSLPPYDNNARNINSTFSSTIESSASTANIGLKFQLNDLSKDGAITASTIGVFSEIQRPSTNTFTNTSGANNSPINFYYAGFFRTIHAGNGVLNGTHGVLGRGILSSDFDGASVNVVRGGSFVGNVMKSLNNYVTLVNGAEIGAYNNGRNCTVNEMQGAFINVYNRNGTAGQNSIVNNMRGLIVRVGTDQVTSPTSTIQTVEGIRIENYTRGHYIKNFYGINFRMDSNGINGNNGMYENFYGLFLENNIATNRISGNRFGIYQTDINSKNIFSGKVCLTSDLNKTRNNVKLQIEGNLTFNLLLDTVSTADVTNGTVWVEADPLNPNTNIRFKYKGNDGVIRSSAYFPLT